MCDTGSIPRSTFFQKSVCISPHSRCLVRVAIKAVVGLVHVADGTYPFFVRCLLFAISVFSLQDDGSAETAAQNILAIALSLLLLLAFTSILWRIALVSWALISAAVRYSIVGVLLLVLGIIFL